MTNAIKDNNNVNTMIGVLNTDGVTVTLIKAEPSTNAVCVDDNSSGSDFGSNDATKDSNNVSTLLATSSSDGTTPVPLYVDSSGILLIKSV